MKYPKKVLEELLDEWFTDDKGKYSDTLFKFADELVDSFLYGEDSIYYQRERAIPCLRLLQRHGIIDYKLSFEEAHRQGKERATKKISDAFSSDVVQNAMKRLKDQLEKLSQGQEMPQEKELSDEEQREKMRKSLINGLCLN